MRMFKTLGRNAAIATGILIGLAGCSPTQTGEVEDPGIAQSETKDASQRAYFETLLSSPRSVTEDAEIQPVDFAAAFSSLPESVRVETGVISVDPELGATRVEDFAIVTDLNGTGVGVRADEVLFYDFDPNAIADRISGANTTEQVKVADRIELRRVRSIGMEAVSELFLQQYTEALDEFTPIDDLALTEINALEIFSYNFEMEKLLVDGFVLEPFILAALPDDEVDAGAQALQLFGALARGFSYDAIAYNDVTIDYSMQQDGLEIGAQMTLDLAGSKAYERGDLEYSGSWGTRFEGAFPVPDEAAEDERYLELPLRGKVAYSGVSGLRLARAFEALANWEVPSSDQADFMDFGDWEVTGYSLDLADQSVLNADRVAFKMDFHWLLPTDFKLVFENSGYNIGNLLSVVTETLGEELEPGLSAEDLKTGLDIAAQYGFDCFCGDYELQLSWDETSGDILYRESSQFAEAFSGWSSAELGFSTPAKIAALFYDEDVESGLEESVIADFEFRSFESSMTDLGGLSDLFEMLHAIGQAFPEQEGMAMLTYNDATQLRALAVNMLVSMKPVVRQSAPSADPMMDAVAAFLEEGGTLTLSVKPDQPIDATFLESQEDFEADPTPDEIIEMLGLTVTHTK